MKHFQELALLINRKIIQRIGREVTMAAHGRAQFFFGVINLFEVRGLHLNLIRRIAPNRGNKLWQRQNNLIVRAARLGKAAMLFQHAHHFKLAFIHENFLPQRRVIQK